MENVVRPGNQFIPQELHYNLFFYMYIQLLHNCDLVIILFFAYHIFLLLENLLSPLESHVYICNVYLVHLTNLHFLNR